MEESLSTWRTFALYVAGNTEREALHGLLWDNLGDAQEYARENSLEHVFQLDMIASVANMTEAEAEPAANGGLSTWTFVGHWENDEIVVEYVLEGEQQDPREDTGHWEQGLFAEAASGATQDEALAAVRAKYADKV